MTQKPTEFGLGKTDFCHNCKFYSPCGTQDESYACGSCRANPPTHNGFPTTYASQWCRFHELTQEEQAVRLKEVSELNKASREPGRIFSPDEPITIMLNAGKLQQTRYDTLSDGVNTWEHYPDVDGL